MSTRVLQFGRRSLVPVTAWVIGALSPLAVGQESPAPTPTAGPAEGISGIAAIGRLQERRRRARERESLYQRLEAGYGDYVRWKARFERDTRIDFSVDVSFLEQWGFPNGGSPSLQIYAAPTLDWTAFESKEWGTGSVLIAYSYVPHYPTRQNAADITARLGLITPI